jgi:hypothetical protein
MAVRVTRLTDGRRQPQGGADCQKGMVVIDTSLPLPSLVLSGAANARFDQAIKVVGV